MAVINTVTQSHLVEKGFIPFYCLSPSAKEAKEFKAGDPNRNHRERLLIGLHWQAQHACSEMVLSALGPPTSVNNQETAPKTYPQTNMMEAMPQLKSRCVMLTMVAS